MQTVTVYEELFSNQAAGMENIIANYREIFSELSNVHTLRTVAPGLSMEDTILEEYRLSIPNVNLNYMVGTSFNGQSNTIVAWFNNQAFHTVPLTVNLINNAILRQLMIILQRISFILNFVLSFPDQSQILPTESRSQTNHYLSHFQRR